MAVQRQEMVEVSAACEGVSAEVYVAVEEECDAHVAWIGLDGFRHCHDRCSVFEGKGLVVGSAFSLPSCARLLDLIDEEEAIGVSISLVNNTLVGAWQH